MKDLFSFVIMFLVAHSLNGQNLSIDSLAQTVGNTNEELIKIKNGYYVIQPAAIAGNTAVYIGPNEVILVDPQWAKLVPRIKEIVSTITDKPIKYVINTHYHFDHTDGNKALGNEGIPIIAQKNTRNRLMQDQMLGIFGIQKPFPPKALPTITFDDTLKLYDTEEIIELIHFPNAHTDGDAVVHFKNVDIYHTGDLFEPSMLPFIDENGGADIYGVIRAINYLLSVSNKDTRFIPGHGPVCTIEELTTFKNLLTSIRDQVVSGIKQGISLEQIINAVVIDKNVLVLDKNGFISHVYRMALKHENIGVKKEST